MALGSLIGGGIAAIGLIGGLTQDEPDPINVNYPDPDPIEMEMARIQLKIARDLKEQIGDPKIMQEIFRLLPAEKMSAEDRAAFTDEYAQISQTIASTSLQQSSQAMGQDIQSLVDRGVIGQDTADRMRAKNESAISSVESILNKKLEANRIGMARGQFISKQSRNMSTAGLLAQVDDNTKRMFNVVSQNALSSLSKRRENIGGLQQALATTNNELSLSISGAKQDFGLQTAITAGTTYFERQKEKREREQTLADWERFKDL